MLTYSKYYNVYCKLQLNRIPTTKTISLVGQSRYEAVPQAISIDAN